MLQGKWCNGLSASARNDLLTVADEAEQSEIWMSAHYKKKTPGLHSWSALWKMAWKNQHQKKKKDEPLHCARLGNVCIRSSTSISLKETGSVCVWQKRKGLTGTGRTQRGQFWVSGIGLVPLQWWWFLVRSSFLTHISRRLTPAATSMLPTSRFKPRSRPSSR